MRTCNLCIVGFGNVAKAFVALLARKEQELAQKHSLRCRITGVASRRLGWLSVPAGFDLAKLRAEDFSQAEPLLDIRPWLAAGAADALLEATSLNASTGQPAIDYLRAALETGAHAISANKGPVVHAYRQLTALAHEVGKRYLFESAVMDGVPIFSLFRETMPAVEVRSFRGVLNSTTNVILEGMDAGMSFEDSIREAQALGVAESDPTDDIDGIDAAVKVVALANVLMGGDLTLSQVRREGIRGITPAQLREARLKGEAWKLVCSAERTGTGKVEGQVQPQRLKLDDPLAQVHGTSSIVSFATDILPCLTLTEQDPTVETTAYGLLADLLTAIGRS